jgi:hypothetical protein
MIQPSTIPMQVQNNYVQPQQQDAVSISVSPAASMAFGVTPAPLVNISEFQPVNVAPACNNVTNIFPAPEKEY